MPPLLGTLLRVAGARREFANSFQSKLFSQEVLEPIEPAL